MSVASLLGLRTACCDGKYPFAIGGEGNDPGEFHVPHCLVMDDHDCLYVAVTMNLRIQKFSVE
ncbi:MAG: hypothetical protein NT069_08750 [Planctomycetota bacterium]|nr:hypothetical protein [Planctomycetota bacterium]